jgi:endonuclease/exonuclease/phosphatase family metal-dependent hydrolase
MPTPLRIATFNLENLDDQPGQKPTLAERIRILRPQLKRLRADILCLQEIHGQETSGQPRRLAALRQLLEGTPYANFPLAHTTTTQGQPYDQRNLVILSRFPIVATEQIKHHRVPRPSYRKVTAKPAESAAKDITWERPIFYVQTDLGGGRTLHVINLHLKSKLPTDIPGQKQDLYTWRSASGWAEGYFLSSMQRVGQALEVRVLIDEIFDKAEARGEEALIAVCGDFNADSEDVPMKAIRGPVEETSNVMLAPRVLIPCENTIPESSRYSLLHLGKGAMLDHVLASRGLLACYRGSEIHNELLPDESGAFRTDMVFPESDHAPVVAEFELESP